MHILTISYSQPSSQRTYAYPKQNPTAPPMSYIRIGVPGLEMAFVRVLGPRSGTVSSEPTERHFGLNHWPLPSFMHVGDSRREGNLEI